MFSFLFSFYFGRLYNLLLSTFIVCPLLNYYYSYTSNIWKECQNYLFRKGKIIFLEPPLVLWADFHLTHSVFFYEHFNISTGFVIRRMWCVHCTQPSRIWCPDTERYYLAFWKRKVIRLQKGLYRHLPLVFIRLS